MGSQSSKPSAPQKTLKTPTPAAPRTPSPAPLAAPPSFDPSPFSHYSDIERLFSGPERRHLTQLYKNHGTKRGSDEGLALQGFLDLFPERANHPVGALLERLFAAFRRLSPAWKQLDYEGTTTDAEDLLDWPRFVAGVALMTGRTVRITGENGWLRAFWDGFSSRNIEAGGAKTGDSEVKKDDEFGDLLAMLEAAPQKGVTESAKEDTLFLESSKVWTREDFGALVAGCAVLAKLDLAPPSDPDLTKVTLDNLPAALVDAVFHSLQTLTLKDFYARAITGKLCPNLFQLPRAYIHSRLILDPLPDAPFRLTPPNGNPLYPPLSSESPLLSAETMYLLSLFLPSSYTLDMAPPESSRQGPSVPEPSQNRSWDLLYLASRDGSSLNRFEAGVFRYPAPTLLFLSCEIVAPSTRTPGLDNGTPGRRLLFIFGKQEVWKMNMGNQAKVPQILPGSFLAMLQPTLDLQVPLPSTSQNPANRHLLISPAVGLGIGAPEPGKDGYRLLLDPTLQRGRYTYDPLLGGKQSYSPPSNHSIHWDLSVLEIAVYGLGGPAALSSQKRSWDSDKSAADRRKEVQIRKAGGAIDRDLLVMAGVLSDHVEGMGVQRYKTEKEKEQEKYAKEMGHF